MDPSDYDNKNPAGYVNPRHNKPRTQKIKWTPENDRKLLLIAFGREISNKEYKIIAEQVFWAEKPTPKAVQERLTKLRGEQKRELEKLGITGPTTTLHPVREEDNYSGDDQPSDSAGNTSRTPADMDAANALMSISTTAVNDDDDDPSVLTTTNSTGKKRTAKSSNKTNKKPKTSASSPFFAPSPFTSTTETKEESQARRFAEAKAANEEQEGENEE